MGVHMTESEIYGGSWGTDEMRDLFDDRPRTRAWCRLIGVLAEAQAEVGLIPPEAAEEVSRVCRDPDLSMDRLREGYQRTGHSTLGLIRVLKEQCGGDAGEWVYYGATVQDITDTWLMQALNRVWSIVRRDLREIITTLLEHARDHRETQMVGRTHGQAGSPITFGWKSAVWADEMDRHRVHLENLKSDLSHGQLGGAVGALTAYGEKGSELQRAFFRRLELDPPDIAWISSRDRIVRFVQLLARVASTAERIGNEVYNLQRPEIGELREGTSDEVVGSITMPHKRNPERSEHIGTLARIVRSQSALLTDSMVHEHERDGRSWKTEWEAVPAACLATGAVLEHTRELVARLEVDVDAMQQNLDDREGRVFSEQIMIELAEYVGKQTAHRIVRDVAMTSQQNGPPFRERVHSDPRITEHLSSRRLDDIFEGKGAVGNTVQEVDRVVQRIQSDLENQDRQEESATSCS